MRFLTFAASEFEDKPEIQGKEGHPFKDFLKSTYQLSDDTITVIVYSLAHCVSAQGTSSCPWLQYPVDVLQTPLFLPCLGYADTYAESGDTVPHRSWSVTTAGLATFLKDSVELLP